MIVKCNKLSLYNKLNLTWKNKMPEKKKWNYNLPVLRWVPGVVL
jgi:hypothetical protein